MFPEILGHTSNAKYERAAAHLITGYNAVHASLRDSFSAGGRVDLSINGHTLSQVPQVYERFMNTAKLIQQIVNEISEEDLLYYWNRDSLEGNRIEIWKEMINSNPNFTHDIIKPSDIYEWGLR